MLVLSRKIGEIVTIGNSIKITVLSFDRGVVRLGIEAPKSIPVHRKEIHDKIINLNRQAAHTELAALQNALADTIVVNSSVAQDKIKLGASISSNKDN